MSTEAPIVIDHANLSVAWAKAFLETMKPGRNLRPMVLTIGGFPGQQPPEVEALRATLDQRLIALDKNPSEISALTIFPHKMWVRRGRPACGAFSELCLEQFLPRMRKRDARNQYGTYFERMMAFSGSRRDGVRVVNQLQFVIDLLKKDRRPRESALQITCFDPAKDHTGQPVRGFPCLQQVSIAYDNDGRLAVNAFYPMQYIFDRAYGNYLGLCHLGDFLAHETQLQFSRLTCFIGKPELGDVPKRDLEQVVDAAKDAIKTSQQAEKSV
jgi:hypothetical protein